MTWLAKHKLLAVAIAAVLAWLLWPRRAPARVKKELLIDSNVYSPTFGLPLDDIEPEEPPTNSIFSRTFGRQATIDELNERATSILNADAGDDAL